MWNQIKFLDKKRTAGVFFPGKPEQAETGK